MKPLLLATCLVLGLVGEAWAIPWNKPEELRCIRHDNAHVVCLGTSRASLEVMELIGNNSNSCLATMEQAMRANEEFRERIGRTQIEWYERHALEGGIYPEAPTPLCNKRCQADKAITAAKAEAERITRLEKAEKLWADAKACWREP